MSYPARSSVCGRVTMLPDVRSGAYLLTDSPGSACSAPGGDDSLDGLKWTAGRRHTASRTWRDESCGTERKVSGCVRTESGKCDAGVDIERSGSKSSCFPFALFPAPLFFLNSKHWIKVCVEEREKFYCHPGVSAAASYWTMSLEVRTRSWTEYFLYTTEEGSSFPPWTFGNTLDIFLPESHWTRIERFFFIPQKSKW